MKLGEEIIRKVKGKKAIKRTAMTKQRALARKEVHVSAKVCS
jgi:hypothetical protein